MQRVVSPRQIVGDFVGGIRVRGVCCCLLRFVQYNNCCIIAFPDPCGDSRRHQRIAAVKAHDGEPSIGKRGLLHLTDRQTADGRIIGEAIVDLAVSGFKSVGGHELVYLGRNFARFAAAVLGRRERAVGLRFCGAGLFRCAFYFIGLASAPLLLTTLFVFLLFEPLRPIFFDRACGQKLFLQRFCHHVWSLRLNVTASAALMLCSRGNTAAMPLADTVSRSSNSVVMRSIVGAPTTSGNSMGCRRRLPPINKLAAVMRAGRRCSTSIGAGLEQRSATTRHWAFPSRAGMSLRTSTIRAGSSNSTTQALSCLIAASVDSRKSRMRFIGTVYRALQCGRGDRGAVLWTYGDATGVMMKLKQLRVLDLSRFLPGPYVGLALADHGAEVIKIESFAGEPTRHLGPAIKGFSVYFRNTQRGKLSLRLNLKSPEGHEIFMRLARDADVIIESFRPGVARRLGIDYDALRETNPGIVYCALSAFGQDGALAARPSHDLGAQALTGTLSLAAGDDGPALPASPVADVALGSLALAGIMMALYRRSATGRGDYLDMAMTDALMSWNPHIISAVIAENSAPDPARERLYGGAAFYQIYATADDRHLVLSGAEMNFVENLLTALERPDLIPLCELPWGPEQDPVKAFLRSTFLSRTLAEWDEWLADKGICYAPVYDLKEAWQQPWLRARGTIETGADGVERLATPIRFRHEPGRAADKLSGLGEDNEAVLTRLGYDAAARREFYARGVC